MTTEADAAQLVEARVELQVGGRPRRMLVVRAADIRPGAPIVVALHGSNQTGEGLRRFAGGEFDRFAVRDKAVLLYLDGHQKHWNDARVSIDFATRLEGYDDVAFVLAAVDWAVGRLGADADRVFAVGFSNGGALVIRLAHEIPERFAGAATIGATVPAPENFLLADARPGPLRMLYINGTSDPLVPYEGGVASLWGLKPRGLGLSAVQSAEHSAMQNGIIADPIVRDLPATDRDKTTVTVTDWAQDGHEPVRLITVHGGGHTVPGHARAPILMGRTSHQFSAADAIAEFLEIAGTPARD
ncbi:CE1 family esterase [Rathayibacter sp. CAU 1779]